LKKFRIPFQCDGSNHAVEVAVTAFPYKFEPVPECSDGIFLGVQFIDFPEFTTVAVCLFYLGAQIKEQTCPHYLCPCPLVGSFVQ
jgi:hypothetical protein